MGWGWSSLGCPNTQALTSFTGLDRRLCDCRHRGSGVWSHSLGFRSDLALHKAGAFLKGPVGNTACALSNRRGRLCPSNKSPNPADFPATTSLSCHPCTHQPHVQMVAPVHSARALWVTSGSGCPPQAALSFLRGGSKDNPLPRGTCKSLLLTRGKEPAGKWRARLTAPHLAFSLSLTQQVLNQRW